MTHTHALFLEWFAIGQATQAGRYSLENGNAGARPYTPAPLEADCHEIHETAATLLATLRQSIFEPLLTRSPVRGQRAALLQILAHDFAGLRDATDLIAAHVIFYRSNDLHD